MAQQRFDFTLGIKADTSQAEQKMNDLANSLKKIASNPPSLLDDQDLKDATKSAQELEKHLSKAVNVNTGKLDLSKFSKSLSSAGQDLTYFQKNLSKLGVEGEQAFLKLAENIAMAEVPTVRLNNHLKNFLDELIKVGRWQLSSNIMHGLQGAIQTAYGYAQDLNESLTNIRIVTGQSTDEMAKFALRANDAAKALSTTTTNYTDAALIFYQQGLAEDEVEERTNATIKMANATGENVTKISDQLTAVWNNFDNGTKPLEYYADVMTALGAATASSTDEIAEGIEKFASISEMIGLSYEYAASALTTVTDVTRQSADVVGTAFKTIFARIQGLKLGDTLEDGTSLNKYSQALASVGISIFDQNQQLKDMDDILDEMGAKWSLLSRDQQAALAQTVAGVRQYNQLVSLMDNWDFFKQNVNVAKGSEGTLTEQAAIYEESWEASLKRVRASAEGIYDNLIDEELFIKINDIFANLLDGINGIVTGLGGMEGILYSLGGVFLTYFAKKMPSVISNLTNSFNVLTGRAKKSMDEFQKENIKNLSTFIPEKSSEEFEVYREGLVRVAEMKRELANISDTLTQEEEEENQARIKSVEAIYAQAAALQKQADQAKINRDLLEKKESSKTVSDINIFKEKFQKTYTEQQKLQNKQKSGKELDAAEDRRLKKLNEEMEKYVHNYQDLALAVKEVYGIQSKSGNNNKLFSSRDFIDEPEKINAYFDEIAESINKTKQSLIAVSEQSGKYTAMLSAIDHQQGAWEKVSLSVDDAKKKVAEYIDNLEQSAQSSGLTKLTFENNDNIKNATNDLKNFLNEAKSTDQVKDAFLKFLTVFENETTHSLSEVEEEAEDFRSQLIRIFSSLGVENAEEDFGKLEATIKSLSEGELTALLTKLGLTKKELAEIGNHTYHISEGLTDFAGVLMELNGVLNGASEAYKTFNDETATNSEKISTSIGTITSSIFTITQLTSILKKLGPVLQGVAVKAGATSGALAALGKVGGFLAGPYGWIAAAGLTVLTNVLGAYMGAQEEAAEKEKERIESLKQTIQENKEAIKSNTDLIYSMEELYEEYKKTGEGKDKLDDIAQQLATTYGIEGSALAKLTGNYIDYLKVLDEAKQKSKEEIQQQTKQQFLVKNKAGEELQEAAYKWNDTIFQSYLKDNGENGGKIVYSGNDRELEESFTKLISEELGKDYNINTYSNNDDAINSFEIKFDAYNLSNDELVTLYNRIIELNEQTQGKYEKLFNETFNLDSLKSLIENYQTENQEYETLNLLSKDFNIQNYNDYTSWLEQATKTTKQLGLTSEEAETFINNLVSTSGNFKLSEYHELESVLNSLLPEENKFGITKNYIADIFKNIESGVYSYDKLTIASLDWSTLNKQNWKQAADAVQNYNDAVKDVQNYTELRAGAKNAYDLIKEDGITEKNQVQIKESIDWGNTELGIIEFTEFLRLTKEQQIAYIEELKNTNLFEYWNEQINNSIPIIEEYQRETNVAVQNLKTDFQSIFSTASIPEGSSYEEVFLSRYHKLIEKYPGLTDYFKDFTDFKNRYSELELLMEDDDFLIKMGVDSVQFQRDAEEAAKEAEENIELELNTNLSKNAAEYLSNQLKKLIDEYNNYIEIGIDLNSQEAEDKLNEILAKKYKLDVYISNLIADNELNELKELNEAVGLIGDNWVVNKENLEQLEKAFPGILNSYKVLSDGTIQLQEDQAKQFIKTSNIDIETKQKSLRAEAEINENKAKWYNEAADKYENYLSYTNLLDEDAINAKQEAEGKKAQIVNTTNSLTVEDAHETQVDLEKNDNEIYEAYLKVAQGLSTTSSVIYKNMAKDSEAYAKATMLHMQKISLITSEEDTETRAELINQGLTELDVDFSKFSDWNTTYRNYKLDDYYNYDPEGDNKEEKLTEEQKEEIREKEKQRLEAEYAKVLQAWDSKEREDVQKEIAALRAQANNYSNLAANNYATAISLESYKMSYDSSVQNIGKTSSSSTSSYQETDKEYNPYQNVDNTIEAINLKLEEQKAHTEQLQEGTEEHLASLEDERLLTAEIGKYQQEKLNIAENELATLEQKLSQFGAEYDPLTRKIVNYDEIVNAKAREVDRLNKELAAATSDTEKERLQEQVDVAEKLYNNVKELADEHSNTVDIINDTTTALRENGQAIEDNIKTQEEFNKELQKAREEIEKTNKEIQETIDNLKDEVDIYHQLNHELDKQNEESDRLSKLKNSLYGENYIKAAKQELEVVKQTQKTYEDLLNTTLDDLENAMSKATVHFDTKIVYDEDGAILNYQELQEELIRKAETTANNLTAANIHSLTLPEEQREEYLKPYQDAYDNALAAQKDGQDAINKVHDLRDQAYNYGQQARDSFYEGLDLQAELWDYKFNLQIEINDNDLEELEKQLEKIEDKGYEMSEAIALINTDFRSLYENNYTYLQSEIDNLQNMYDADEITEEAYIERLKKIQEEAKEAANELEELDEKVYEYYGITLEKANEELEFYVKQMEHATEVLDHYKNIIELVNGEYDYERLGIVLEGQAHNLQNEMEVAVKWFETLDAEKAAIEAELANPGISDEQREKLKEAYEPIYEAWMEAHDEMLSKTTEWVEATKAVMENTMAKAARDLEMSFTDGVGFDALNDSMDRLNEYSDIYLTKTNQIYEIQKIMRTAQQAADKTDNASSKQRLKAFMDELEDLQEKNKLSNLELEIAQKKYDLLEAQIALEEAQNAKSTVRLQRDSEGNFGYVYTANQEQVAEAEMQVYEAEQKLYNLALESANDYAQKRIELQQSLYDDLVELEENRVAGMYATEEEYNKAREKLIKEYNDLFIAYEDQYNLAIEADGYLRLQIAERYNKQQLSDTIEFLDESTQNVLKTTTLQQETWITHFDNILEKTRGWREKTDDEYNKSAGDASDWLIATKGYLTTCEESYKTWQTIVTEQNKYVQDALIHTQEETNKLTAESDELKTALIGKDGLIAALGSEFIQIRELISAYSSQISGLNDLKRAYNELTNSIKEAIEAANRMPTNINDDEFIGVFEGTPVYKDIVTDNITDKTKEFSKDIEELLSNKINQIKKEDNNPIGNFFNKQEDEKQSFTAQDVTKTVAIANYTGDWLTAANGNEALKDAAYKLYIQASKEMIGYGTEKYFSAEQKNDIGFQTHNQLTEWEDVAEDFNVSKKLLERYEIPVPSGETGMYTGVWGPEGRIAVLHEKELVLNKEDTKNFLHATDILRSISDVIDLQAMSNQFNTLSASIYSGSSGMLEQSVHIEANFPNVSDRNEIEEAFNNLINTASQYANRKTI